MGDRANIYVEMPAPGATRAGVYLYTHHQGRRWPETLRGALEFGKGRWDDDQYLARIITSRVFVDLTDSETGGGLSLIMGDNSYPITVASLIDNTVSFAAEGDETNPEKRYGRMSFVEFVAQSRADYPDEG